MYTDPQIQGSIVYRRSAGKVCAEAHVTASVRIDPKQNVLKGWKPDVCCPEACETEVRRWIKEIESHENAHVAKWQDVADQVNKGWKDAQFSVCAARGPALGGL